MSYRVLPDPRDLDEQGHLQVIEWCKANAIDPVKVPAPEGDPGFGLQIHGDTIRFREYAFDGDGKYILDDPRYDATPYGVAVTNWGERPLVRLPEEFGLTTVKVRA